MVEHCLDNTKEWRRKGEEMSKIQAKIIYLQNSEDKEEEELCKLAGEYNALRNLWQTDDAPGKPDHCTIILWRTHGKK